MEPDTEDDYESPDRIRHAETPELAREALIDSVVLIFKSQVEVAFREQTAGHNALLLFVHLALQMMEEQLLNSFKEVRAKQAEVPLRVDYTCMCILMQHISLGSTQYVPFVLSNIDCMLNTVYAFQS